MSTEFTDELFDLCVAVVDSQHLDKLFLNFGHSDNSTRFNAYLSDMCDIEKLYVIYDYDIYYQGDIVTEEILKEEQKNALVLPVYYVQLSDINNTWESIISSDKSKERVDVTLDCLTHRFALVDMQIFNANFLKYMTFVIKDLVFFPIPKEEDIQTGVRLTDEHVLVVGDAVQLADFELEMKRFFEAHIMKTL